MQRGCRGHLGTLQPPNSTLTAPGLDHSSRAPLSVLLHTSPPFFSCCLTRYPSKRAVSLVCPHDPIQSPPASHPLHKGLLSCSSSCSKFPLTPSRVSMGPALKPGPRTWFVLPSFPCGITTLFLSGADACQGSLWRCQSPPPRAPHKQFHFPPVGQPWQTEERDRSAPGGEIRPQPQVASPTTAGFVELGHATSLLKTLQHFLLAPGVPQSFSVEPASTHVTHSPLSPQLSFKPCSPTCLAPPSVFSSSKTPVCLLGSGISSIWRGEASSPPWSLR